MTDGRRRSVKKKRGRKENAEEDGRDVQRKKHKSSSGPRLPSALRRELDLLGDHTDASDGGEENAGDVYEYEEDVPQEESRKNRRFDCVDNLEYELPSDFEDDDIASEEDEDVPTEDEGLDMLSNHEVRDGHAGKHVRMLEGITGIPGTAFFGKNRKDTVLMDAIDISGSNSQIDIHDLLDPLHGRSGYNKLRKTVQQQEKKPMILHPPLPRIEREKLERQVAYDFSKKDITKWEPLVKRNREAPTIYFETDTNLGFSTVGSIASTFEPRTEFEKKMADLMNDPEIVEAHNEDGKRLLEFNKVSVEDVKDRQARLAKMRSLLFLHDMKAKRIKKIKSKAYHRMLKKDKVKAAGKDALVDPEAIREAARKQEFKRAEERLTLKHKNKSKWAQRILKRGMSAQDEGTRAAITEQLRHHEQLTRKMNSMRDTSSEESSSDEEEDNLSQDDTKTLLKARDKTIKVIEEEDKVAKSGVLSLPFMVRGLKKKREAAEEEAQHALNEYDMSLGRLGDTDGQGSPKSGTSGGRKVFGAPKVPPKEPLKQNKNDYDIGSDSEAEINDLRENDNTTSENVELQKGQQIDEGSLLVQPLEKQEDAASKNLNIDRRDLGSKTTYDVAIFASGAWRKVSSGKPRQEPKEVDIAIRNSSVPAQKIDESDVGTDVESEDEMVDGVPASHDRLEYELPSQPDLIRRAFAGDDVELEFEHDKMEILNEEVPEPEKPLLLPGWGQWTDVQRKKGPPTWMLKEHEDGKRKREEALRKRKDARLKHVIISEKPDKKAEKLQTKSLPFPFTSKEVFEQSLRMPIGPDFNPAISVQALIRPSVVKEAGMKIEPIKYEEVDPYQKSMGHEGRSTSKLQKGKKTKNAIGIVGKKGRK